MPQAESCGLYRFKRSEHLKRRKEIQEVFGKGKRHNCFGAKLFVLKSGLPYNRICFTCGKASKKSPFAWNAVSRNRAKRLGREAFRLMKPRLESGYDLILLIYPDADKSKEGFGLADRTRQLEYLFAKAGLLK